MINTQNCSAAEKKNKFVFVMPFNSSIVMRTAQSIVGRGNNTYLNSNSKAATQRKHQSLVKNFLVHGAVEMISSIIEYTCERLGDREAAGRSDDTQ